MTPTKRLTDPTFRYTSAAATDIRRTFAKARRAMREAELVEQAKREQVEREASKVQTITTLRKVKA